MPFTTLAHITKVSENSEPLPTKFTLKTRGYIDKSNKKDLFFVLVRKVVYNGKTLYVRNKIYRGGGKPENHLDWIAFQDRTGANLTGKPIRPIRAVQADNSVIALYPPPKPKARKGESGREDHQDHSSQATGKRGEKWLDMYEPTPEELLADEFERRRARDPEWFRDESVEDIEEEHELRAQRESAIDDSMYSQNLGLPGSTW